MPSPRSNVGLIPAYKDFFKAFQSPSTNTVGGKHYGISLQFGPNLLLYNTAKEKKPSSWSVIYDPKNKGKITIPDNPIQIADAALYLSKTKPALGITDPYELDEGAARRRGGAPEAAAAPDQEVLGARVGPDRSVQERRLDARCVVAVQYSQLRRRRRTSGR